MGYNNGLNDVNRMITDTKDINGLNEAMGDVYAKDAKFRQGSKPQSKGIFSNLKDCFREMFTLENKTNATKERNVTQNITQNQSHVQENSNKQKTNKKRGLGQLMENAGKFKKNAHNLNKTENNAKNTQAESVHKTDNIDSKSESSISKFFDDLKADIKQIAHDFKSETKKLGNFFRAVGIALKKLDESLNEAEDKKGVQLAFKKFTVDYKLARGLLNLGDKGKGVYRSFSDGNLKEAMEQLKNVDSKELKKECKALITALGDAIEINAKIFKHDTGNELKKLWEDLKNLFSN